MMCSDVREIKAQIKRHGLFQYEVAAALGITEQAFSGWLRRPLTEERDKRIKAAIKKAFEQKREMFSVYEEVV